MHSLIRELLVRKLANPILQRLSDSAVLNFKGRTAFTTDSFVVNPLYFPGGDIGKLSVCGTVNDLVMLGAIPEYLSLALIVEEGFEYRELEKIVDSIAQTAKAAGVYFVTGDIKVVEKGACDKIFINTSGVGRIITSGDLSVKHIKPNDRIIITGTIAQHGLAVLSKRNDLGLGFDIKSDCASLNELLIPIIKKTPEIKFMRDPTRGGLATTLNEVAESTRLGVMLDEKNIPIASQVRAGCELLGIDPLYIASEGRAILAVEPGAVKKVLQLLHRHPLGRQAREIGRIVKQPKGKVILNTVLDTQRIVDMLTSEPIPRIC